MTGSRLLFAFLLSTVVPVRFTVAQIFARIILLLQAGAPQTCSIYNDPWVQPFGQQKFWANNMSPGLYLLTEQCECSFIDPWYSVYALLSGANSNPIGAVVTVGNGGAVYGIMTDETFFASVPGVFPVNLGEPHTVDGITVTVAANTDVPPWYSSAVGMALSTSHGLTVRVYPWIQTTSSTGRIDVEIPFLHVLCGCALCHDGVVPTEPDGLGRKKRSTNLTDVDAGIEKITQKMLSHWEETQSATKTKLAPTPTRETIKSAKAATAAIIDTKGPFAPCQDIGLWNATTEHREATDCLAHQGVSSKNTCYALRGAAFSCDNLAGEAMKVDLAKYCDDVKG